MAKEFVLLTNKKPYYKGNMHCHSTLSDGIKTPEELKEWFKGHGYHFLAITDHERTYNQSALDDEEFITITSSEISVKEFPAISTGTNRRMKVCHFNIYAKEQDNDATLFYSTLADHYSSPEDRERLAKELGDATREYTVDYINNLIRTANEAGFFVAYNHPRWSLENYGNYGGYEGLWGVEIFNTSCDRGGLYEYDINVLDDFLRDGKHVFASCGDDNHSERTCGGAFVMVNADKLSYKNLIDGLLSGRFYASTGPEIYDLTVCGNQVHITCSGAKHITYATEGRRAAAVHATDTVLTEATFTIQPDDGYFRLDVIDEAGCRANTQAYYVKDFEIE